MRINLTKSELYICRILGVMRRSTALDRVEDQQMGKQSPWDIDMYGMIAEFCVAKEFNWCPDLTIGIRSGGKDLETYSGQSVDVKSTNYKTGKLLCTLKKAEDPCDIYVLVVTDDHGGTIAGWAKKEEIFLEENKQDLGHGIGYALEQKNLNQNMEQLAHQ
jgi:hypothetical protein